MQRANIEYAKMQMSAKEEKAGNGDGENGEENEENEEEEEEGEDFEEKIRDMQDKLQELLSGIDEGRDGKLPDTVVIQLRTFYRFYLSLLVLLKNIGSLNITFISYKTCYTY